jgi:hypothetical protein
VRLEKALDWLETAYEAHDPAMAKLGTDPDCAPLREYPRSLHLLNRMNLPR